MGFNSSLSLPACSSAGWEESYSQHMFLLGKTKTKPKTNPKTPVPCSALSVSTDNEILFFFFFRGFSFVF